MKKIPLILMVAMLAAINLYADEEEGGGMGKWQKTFQPVANADDMGTVHVAQAPDGSVYVSSKWNAALQFAEKNVAEPEIQTSSIILKYDADGEEKWAVVIDGCVLVNTMAVDVDGRSMLLAKLWKKQRSQAQMAQAKRQQGLCATFRRLS
ncbi:MAG: hypothetical protein IKP41_09160 [Bacteroidaceae bacterium]|nr:hypothetical protein [Bacteroidaceae bacterium]